MTTQPPQSLFNITGVFVSAVWGGVYVCIIISIWRAKWNQMYHIHSLNTESYWIRQSHTVHCDQVQLSNHHNQPRAVCPYSTPVVYIQYSCDSSCVRYCFRWLSSCPYILSEYRVHICVLGHQNRRISGLGHRWQTQSRAVCVTTFVCAVYWQGHSTPINSRIRSVVGTYAVSCWWYCYWWGRYAWTLMFRCWWMLDNERCLATDHHQNYYFLINNHSSVPIRTTRKIIF